MTLIFVRHGETAHNAQRRFQGQTNIPLSARGREQARAAAEALRTEAITHLYSSDLARAYQTAEAIAAAQQLPIVADERLREFHFGSWEGLTWDEIVAKTPGLALDAWRQPRYYTPPGGESFETVVARVRAFLDEVRELPDDAVVAVVAHAGVLHAAIAVLEPKGIDPLAISFANGSVLKLPLPR